MRTRPFVFQLGQHLLNGGGWTLWRPLPIDALIEVLRRLELGPFDIRLVHDDRGPTFLREDGTERFLARAIMGMTSREAFLALCVLRNVPPALLSEPWDVPPEAARPVLSLIQGGRA